MHIPILCMRRLRHGNVKWLAQDHAVSNQEGWIPAQVLYLLDLLVCYQQWVLLRVTYLWPVSLKVLGKSQGEISSCSGWFLRSQVKRDVDANLRVWGAILETHRATAVGCRTTGTGSEAREDLTSCATSCATLGKLIYFSEPQFFSPTGWETL